MLCNNNYNITLVPVRYYSTVQSPPIERSYHSVLFCLNNPVNLLIFNNFFAEILCDLSYALSETSFFENTNG